MSSEPDAATFGVRAATRGDLSAIKAIYDVHVLTTVATFEVEPPPIDHWEQRLGSTAGGDHLLVATSSVGSDPGSVLGYAYSSSYRPRPAYDRTREVSVYLAADAGGRGIGRALYDALLDLLRADGMHTVLAVIARPNPASEALHRACGFELVGVLPEVGRKFDRWIDTGLWALRIEA